MSRKTINIKLLSLETVIWFPTHVEREARAMLSLHTRLIVCFVRTSVYWQLVIYSGRILLTESNRQLADLATISSLLLKTVCQTVAPPSVGCGCRLPSAASQCTRCGAAAVDLSMTDWEAAYRLLHTTAATGGNPETDVSSSETTDSGRHVRSPRSRNWHDLFLEDNQDPKSVRCNARNSSAAVRWSGGACAGSLRSLQRIGLRVTPDGDIRQSSWERDERRNTVRCHQSRDRLRHGRISGHALDTIA